MINVTVIALGKLKEKYMRDFCDEYVKRLSAYCKLNIVELAPKALPDNPSQTEIMQALSAEAQMIKAKIPQNSYVFSMCIEGKQMPSEAFSQKLSKLAIDGKSSIVFIIGSSFGLDSEIKKLSDERFSYSAQASLRYFSLSLPTQMIFILIKK